MWCRVGDAFKRLYAFEMIVEVIVGTSFPHGTFDTACSGGRCWECAIEHFDKIN